jgi:hypothetical protein
VLSAWANFLKVSGLSEGEASRVANIFYESHLSINELLRKKAFHPSYLEKLEMSEATLACVNLCIKAIQDSVNLIT